MVKDIVNDNIDKILDNILKELDEFDGSIESAVNIVESNESSVQTLKELLASENMDLSDRYQSKIQAIIANQKNLIDMLEREKEDLRDKIGQIGRKNQVVNSYMKKINNAIFIDKDM